MVFCGGVIIVSALSQRKRVERESLTIYGYFLPFLFINPILMGIGKTTDTNILTKIGLKDLVKFS